MAKKKKKTYSPEKSTDVEERITDTKSPDDGIELGISGTGTENTPIDMTDVTPQDDVDHEDSENAGDADDKTDESTIAEDSDENGTGSNVGENTEMSDGHFNSESAPLPDTQTRKMSGKAKKTLIIAAATVALIASALISFAAIIVNKLSEPIVAEVGEAVDLSRFDSGSAKLFCKIDADNDLSTDKIGSRDIKVEFFGFLDHSIPLIVEDTTPPEFTLHAASVMAGIRLSPEDLVTDYSDKTNITFSFESDPDFSNVSEKEVTVVAEDEGGNLSKKSTVLIVSDVPFSPDFEFGTTAEEIERRIRADHPETVGIDLSGVDVSKCGEYKASAESDTTYFLFFLNVRDTVAPSAIVNSFDVLLGETVDEDLIVTDISDLSPTSVKFEAVADFGKAGAYDIPITVSDDQGNVLSLTSKIVVHDLNSSITSEPISSNEELLNLFFKDKNESLSLPDGFSAADMHLGVNFIDLIGEFNSIRVSINVEDTIPPVLTLHPLSVLSGRSVTPEQFVTSCYDSSPVMYSFEDPVSTKASGEYIVTVVASDSAGNKTSETTVLTVTIDTVPPVFYGVQNITVTAGETISSYLSQVYAVDDVDGVVGVSVDATKVNMQVPGYYTITYSAKDSYGNIGVAYATVVVQAIGLDTVYGLANEILSQITNASMTQRQKAWAIYTWCTSNIRYSTATSYLMGNFIDAAYSGLRIRSGNCYTYYAVASALLTCAGIENIEVHRDSATSPHYWNLVKIGSSWYHFDTCPHYSAFPITVFLLTDAQVEDYSQNRSVGYYSFNKSLYPRTP